MEIELISASMTQNTKAADDEWCLLDAEIERVDVVLRVNAPREQKPQDEKNDARKLT